MRAGKWSDASLWNTGKVPAAGDTVIIAAGMTVTYDRFSEAEMAKVVIRGTLAFSRSVSTRLDTGNVIVESAGYLDMGTPTSPIEPSADAELRLVTRPTATCVGGASFAENDVGVWVMAGGRWDVHGTPVRHTWAKLIADAGAGATLLKVRENVSDWEAGSTVLVTPTGMGPALLDFEEIPIVRAYYAGDHSEIVLSKPLRVLHQGSGLTAGEVALLSHNVVVTSKYPDYPMLGHTMFMANAKGNIAYAEFRDLGMFGCLGRYPLHFHMLQDGSRGMSVRGASIWRSDNHFMNIHASNGLLMEDTVGYDTTGVGFFIGEAAMGMVTVDTVMIHNLAAKVVWRTGALDGQQRATGFWIESRNATLIDNVASGAWGTSKFDSGFHLAEHGTSVSGFHPLVMARNEAHSNKSNGFFSWSNAHERFLVQDFAGWRNGNAGIYWGAYTTKFQIHRAKLYENKEANLINSVIRMHLQDSELFGTSAFPTPLGIFLGSYAVANDPTTPAKLLRNSLSGHGMDISQDHAPCAAGSAEEFNPLSRMCPAIYVVAVGNRLRSPEAIDFGWQRNANSWIDVRSWDGITSPNPPVNFRLLRKDLPRPDADAMYSSIFDAWLDPLSASAPLLGLSAGSGGALVAVTGPAAAPARPTPGRSPTPAPTSSGASLPPTIAFLSPQEGQLLSASLTLEVSASGLQPISKVEFFADEILLATVTASPYRITWTTAAWVRKRAYVYACATDVVGNVACTAVLKLNRTAP